ncbi:MAG: 3'(2'),5'-bisphosphate nucleotidase CysQ [Acidimicrobiaceae bacterium]|jgi:3'(2'), 5'-bisphosphate nucleotidase|nr:3'(2'),5'-bisphosphate nucleotidase CysQ [Acidimicrobiaceae bacterium]|tara:strand:+ start:36143 stop:36886 length:744 start_codon:yes stop_codon:yes gene_type:complete
MPTESDFQLARESASLAGKLLMLLRKSASDSDVPSSTLGEIADKESHELLCGLILDVSPDDAILSEEQEDDLKRLDSNRVWIIDPLDGTKEFGETDRSDWAVHVALVEGGIPTVGAVAMPDIGTTFCSNDPSLPLKEITEIRITSSRTRPVPAAQIIADELSGEIILMGSAGAKAMAVVKGDAEIYVHTGGQYEWDSCAPVAVALANGLHASKLDGSPLLYNQRNTYLPELLICRKELADSVLAIFN